MTDMLQVNVAPHRNETGGNGERVAERAVGVGKAEEEVAVLVVRRAADDVPVASQHVERMHRVVDESVPERRGLDADAGDARRRAVIDLSCGTTAGMAPCASVASASRS